MKKVILIFCCLCLLGGNLIAAQKENSMVDREAKQLPPPQPLSSPSKNGFFIGVEMDLGGLNFQNLSYETSSVASMPDVSRLLDRDLLNSFTFDGGLMGGYQYYFKDHPDIGIKVSGHLYLGYVNFDDEMRSMILTLTQASESKNNYYYIPIRLGFDVKYLWDFFKQSDHTLGLNVGVGYQANFYTFGKMQMKIATKVTETKIPFLFSDDFYPILGLHYYYRNHQFELMYRFGGIGKGEAEGTLVYDNKTTIMTARLFNKRSFLTFNYAYRF